MNKFERIKAAIARQPVDHVPACFSIHFPREKAFDKAGADAHIDFYRRTGCDVLKIMNENLVPALGEMTGPSDWLRLPAYNLRSPFIVRQLDMIKRILDAAGPGVYALATIHSVCASAIHPLEERYGYEAVRQLQVDQWRGRRGPMLDAFRRITDVMSELAAACIRAGCAGIYCAALGGEKRYFTDEEFAQAIAPFDKRIMSAAKEAGGDVFLHICKDGIEMSRYESYRELCDVVNWGVYEVPCTLDAGRKLFPDAAVMGGLKNHSGALVEGPVERLEERVRDIIRGFGEVGFILGADCTLPTDIPPERIAAAVHAAAVYK